MEKAKIYEALEAVKTRSAWSKGVKEYAYMILEDIEDEAIAEATNKRLLEETLLNGAENWTQYSWGGCALIYDRQIAEGLCSPSELKKTRNGERRPNKREEWLDTQARALYQAFRLVAQCAEM